MSFVVLLFRFKDFQAHLGAYHVQINYTQGLKQKLLPFSFYQGKANMYFTAVWRNQQMLILL